VQGFRIILKKGLRKQEKLGYVVSSYGKKRRLAEHSRRAKATPRNRQTGHERLLERKLAVLASSLRLGERTGQEPCSKIHFRLDTLGQAG
jgi:hypothetical protein